MPVSVVVGGQFGSEGKGKVAHFLAKERDATYAVRVGGPNSGHTVVNASGKATIFRQLPTPCILPNIVSVIPPGSYVDVDLLLDEISRMGLAAHRVAIDPKAWIIQSQDVLKESKSGLRQSIGSTGSGTGAALLRRIQRSESPTFAKDVDELKPYIRDTTAVLVDAVKKNERIIIEGTQGFGLSVLHSDLYPFCTSRDTGAASFTAEAGLSPLDVDEVVLVIRTFPIRVAGHSGPLKQEFDWATLTQESGAKSPLVELTSVTKQIRRVARFDADLVKRAIAHNRPTSIALNHLDYVDDSCSREGRLTQRALDCVRKIEQLIEAPIALVGYGPASIVWRDIRAEHLRTKSR